MQTIRKWPSVCLIALLSEVYAIRWRWEAAPTDQLRAWYEESFRTYLLESITPWLVAFSVLMALWLLITRIVTRWKQTLSDGAGELVRSQERFQEWSEATDILGRIKATEALDTLIGCLDCNDGRFGLSLGRFPAALAVLRFGEMSIPKLSAALRHKNPMVRHKAAEVLYAMGGDTAKQEVKKALPNERVPWIAQAMKNMLGTWHVQRKDH